MQELLFGLAGSYGALCVPSVFISVTEKEHNFQTNENIALPHLKRKKERNTQLI